MMHRVLRALPVSLSFRLNRSRHSSTSTVCTALRQVDTIFSKLDQLDIVEFRRKAFLPQLPLLTTVSADLGFNTFTSSSILATSRWFKVHARTNNSTNPKFRYILNRSYLEPYGNTVLPYELLGPLMSGKNQPKDVGKHFGKFIDPKLVACLFPGLVGNQDLSPCLRDSTFYAFHAPLDLFLQASRGLDCESRDTASNGDNLAQTPRLYIAQAQISELPKQLQDDILAPRVVMEAGKGDIYDANIWLGIPPTYTPLHKDPNPNLFIQLASNKIVRIFSPDVGSAIFRQVQQKIGGNASSTFRGDEMMQGPERTLLEDAVWGCPNVTEGYEVTVRPGDALFIPKGWWHSFKSIGMDITASVNWWFR